MKKPLAFFHTDVYLFRMAKRKFKRGQVAPRQKNRLLDLLQRIAKNPEIAERIPNHANLFFMEGDIVLINGEPKRYSELVWVSRERKGFKKRTTKAISKKNTAKNKEIQRHMDRWADLMHRIVKNPEIADRIPNNANLFFPNDEVVLINGEPRYYRDLVKVERKRKTVPSARKTLKAGGEMRRARRSARAEIA